MLIHQSMLQSWNRCPARTGYELKGAPRQTTSAIAFGNVMHHCMHGLDRQVAEGVPLLDATNNALATFAHYWHPMNIEALTEPVPEDGWIRGQGYAILRQRGLDAIRKYADLLRFDKHQLLALEFSFVVPIDGTWDFELEEPHLLAGTIDRLAIRHFKRQPVLMADDFKTGRTKTYLRHDIQFTAYCYATTRKEFWVGYKHEEGFEHGEDLFELYQDLPRRGTWIDLKNYKNVDAGWRGEQDYERFRMAVTQITSSIQADIFPLNISGENCQYCEYRGICGSTGLPADNHGSPEELVVA